MFYMVPSWFWRRLHCTRNLRPPYDRPDSFEEWWPECVGYCLDRYDTPIEYVNR